ncbi:hypothetical protein HOY82DRAFT_488357, partial [Tuber indicum]
RFYKSLSTKTRLIIGGGVILYAGVGLLLTDVAEEKFDLVPSEEDKRQLKELVPKVRVVDREG